MFYKRKSTLDRKCPRCGISLREIQIAMKFGCGECYKFFDRKSIEKIIAACQNGQTIHIGKKPGSCKKLDKNKILLLDPIKERDDLKKTLKTAIEEEDFERAAIIRDKLKELEQKMVEVR